MGQNVDDVGARVDRDDRDVNHLRFGCQGASDSVPDAFRQLGAESSGRIVDCYHLRRYDAQLVEYVTVTIVFVRHRFHARWNESR